MAEFKRKHPRLPQYPDKDWVVCQLQRTVGAVIGETYGLSEQGIYDRRRDQYIDVITLLTELMGELTGTGERLSIRPVLRYLITQVKAITNNVLFPYATE